jgi:uncharacterized repeat protein (TIGR01451 family)
MSSANKSRGHLPVLLRSVAAGLLAFGASQAMALGVTLCAEPYLQNLPGAVGVPMWGYRQVALPADCDANAGVGTASPGPVLSVPSSDTTLTITLVNKLTVPTSVVLAGQSLPSDGGAAVLAADLVGPSCIPTPGAAASSPAHPQNCRVRSFTGETDVGATRTYTFANMRPGTYLYQSGTHPQVQIQMGLFGMAKKDAAPSIASLAGRFLFSNPDWVFDADVPVVLSEIDDAMHQRISATLGSANPASWQAGKNSTFDYNPRFFLINGKPYDGAGATDLPVSTFNGAYVVLRMANAGLKSRSLVLNNGHWLVLTEDGNAYPAPREQYSLLLPAGKTTDAQVLANVPGTGTDSAMALFDRRGGTDNADASPLGGQVARLVFSNGGTAPTDLADLSISKSDGATTVFQGDLITYTVTAVNGGPNPVVAATVTDTPPAALTGVTWTCTASAGSACAAPSGAGSVASSVNLLNGGSATFLVSGTVGVTALLTNSAAIAAPAGITDRRPGNNAATDIDTVLVRTADLSISKTRAAGPVVAGGTVQYSIVVSNPAGSNSPVTAATVTDALPALLSGATWTCSASAGSSCPATGSGSVNTAVNLAIGGSATFTVNANVSAAATGNLVNTASVTAPANVVDAAGNNSATDTATIVALPVFATPLDNFNRTNANTLGASWTQGSVPLVGGTLRVNANQAVANLLGGTGNAYWGTTAPTVFGARQAASMVLTNNPVVNGGAAAAGSSLVLKATGALIPVLATTPNFIRVAYNGAGNLGITTTTNGGLTTTSAATINNANSTFVTGNTLTAMVDAGGVVYVWKNNATFVGSTTLPNVAAWTSGTGRIGMQLPNGARIDNFAGGTVP